MLQLRRTDHHPLVAQRDRTHKPPVASDLFDMKLRAMRRDRAARRGPELFLYERAIEDCLERITMVQRDFASALLVGCPDPHWPARLRERIASVEVVEPGALFARLAGGSQAIEDDWTPPAARYDLCLAMGTLDTINDLPRALLTLRYAMKPDGLLLGAISGGDTLPRLRAAMRSADEISGAASAHVHPRIEPAALAGLLTAAGFAMPVVDVDRVPVSYESLPRLIRDLRAMGATNVLSQRSRDPLSRSAYAAACAAFDAAGGDGRTTETFEILHFAAWSPAHRKEG